MQEQARVTKEQQLYRQDYCGCLFGLSQQRAKQDVIMDEMMEPVTRQILPGSIQECLELYTKRMELEDEGIEYRILRHRFLNYRLLRGFVRVEKEVAPSYITLFSLLRRDYAKARVEFEADGVAYANRDEIRVIDLQKLNSILGTGFKSVKELYFQGLSFAQELSLRQSVGLGEFDLSPLVVLDKIPSKFEIYIHAATYKDIREKIVKVKHA